MQVYVPSLGDELQVRDPLGTWLTACLLLSSLVGQALLWPGTHPWRGASWVACATCPVAADLAAVRSLTALSQAAGGGALAALQACCN